MGFPGNLNAVCTYRLKPSGVLSIELSATADASTLCNLTNHSYFNLDDGGAGDIPGHRIVIDAGAYLPVDADAIPSGVVQPVDGTPFDLRLADDIGASGVQYDHNFCLSAKQGPLRRAAWAQGAASGIEMETWTTEPGVQFYMGHKIKPNGPEGLTGRAYFPSSGFCLEAQTWPDSPNRPYFPQAVLRPGETYRHLTEYRFKLG
jgi:aldose 1-epimerase